MIEAFDFLRQCNLPSVALRLVLAMIFGGMLGIERAKKGRAAGFRTYMFVCMGAALTVLLSQYESMMLAGQWNDVAQEVGIRTDVSRFGAQVINGIGFLGAGTIILTGRQEIKGLTTAAGLWASACMGLAIGSGFYECAVLGFILILVTTVLLDRVSSWIVSTARNMDLYIEFEKMEDLGQIIAVFKDMNIQIFDVDIQREKHPNGSVAIGAVISSRLPRKETHSNVMSVISKFDFVTIVDEI